MPFELLCRKIASAVTELRNIYVPRATEFQPHSILVNYVCLTDSSRSRDTEKTDRILDNLVFNEINSKVTKLATRKDHIFFFMAIREIHNAMHITFKFNPFLHQQSTIAWLIRGFLHIWQAICTDPYARIASIDIHEGRWT